MTHEVRLWLGDCVTQNLCSYQGPLEAPPQMPGEEGLLCQTRFGFCSIKSSWWKGWATEGLPGTSGCDLTHCPSPGACFHSGIWILILSVAIFGDGRLAVFSLILSLWHC